MVKNALAELQSLPEPDRSKLLEYPSLSLKERDRRFSLIRKMMEENNVEAMILLAEGRTTPLTYLGDTGVQILFFPLKGEPIGFQDGGGIAIDRLMKTEAYGIEPWIPDRRFGRTGGKTLSGKLIDILKDRGLAGSRIAILPEVRPSVESNRLMNAIKADLPDVTSADLWNSFVQIWTVMGEEEIAIFRKAALVMEVASYEFVHACKVGNSLANVQNAVMGALLPYGVDMRVPGIGSGPDGGRGVQWKERGLKPPVIARGDLVCSELFCNVGPIEGQVQLTVSIGEPSAEKQKLANLARESCEIGLKTLRPGIIFSQLEEAMAEPNRREGAWRLTPLVHTLNPMEAVTVPVLDLTGPRGFTGANERFKEKIPPGRRTFRPDLVIEEGMGFAFEPNSCYGRTYVNIGGNVLVTRDGCEELNEIPNRMVVVPA